jgi:Zn-dependent M28 family amino/carboxypeptidase
VLGAAGLDTVAARSAKPRDLPGVTVTLRASGSERLAWSRNVIGVLVGSDPKLREEAVVIGAHMDHLGRSGDVVFPGSDDNASGVSALIEIARAFAALPARPRRTVVFAFWTGEEEGKFGSGHYLRHPSWPLARTAVYINLDMIGHPWLPEEMRKLVADTGLPGGEAFLAKVDPKDFAEPGLPFDSPHIEAALRWAGPATGMALHLDHTDGTHGGSDYRDFARARVPFIRFFGNFFPGYHEKGDTPANLDPAQVQRMARLAFATAWQLADR